MVARVRNSPFIPKKDSVRGFVYDVHTGRLDEVDPPTATDGGIGGRLAGSLGLGT